MRTKNYLSIHRSVSIRVPSVLNFLHIHVQILGCSCTFFCWAQISISFPKCLYKFEKKHYVIHAHICALILNRKSKSKRCSLFYLCKVLTEPVLRIYVRMYVFSFCVKEQMGVMPKQKLTKKIKIVKAAFKQKRLIWQVCVRAGGEACWCPNNTSAITHKSVLQLSVLISVRPPMKYCMITHYLITSTPTNKRNSLQYQRTYKSVECVKYSRFFL